VTTELLLTQINDPSDECAKEKRAREYFGIRDNEKFHILDFKEFRRKQRTTGLAYDPVGCAFDGDARMRPNTEKPIAKRKLQYAASTNPNRTPKRGRPSKGSEARHKVTLEELFAANKKQKVKSRLCGDLTKYLKHMRRVFNK
jgi:hypothetical protein